MGKITFVAHDNTAHVAELEGGTSVMHVAKDNAIPGIAADCGGECACGTCHVILENEWFGKTGVPGDGEEQMLFMTPERAKTSRLGCPVKPTKAMNGMTVLLPEFQM